MNKLAQYDPLQSLDAVEQRLAGEGYRFAGGELADFFGGDYGVINLAFFFAGALLLLYLLAGGIAFMTSGGDPKALESAKKTITNAFIGFFLVFTAYWTVQLVAAVLGLSGVSEMFS